MNKWIRILLVGAVAVGTLFPAVRAATYHFNLPEKNLEGATLALGESATLILKGIGESDPADLRTLLCDKKGAVLAASGTNAFARYDLGPSRAAVGTMSLATANLATVFAGAPALAEKSLVLACWDNRLGTLLASANVQVRNNPFAATNGVVPSSWGDVDYGGEAIAQQALAAAQLALNTANAASLDLAALLGDYQTATGALWAASATHASAADVESATNAIMVAISSLQTASSSHVSRTGDTMTGPLVLQSTLTVDSNAVFESGAEFGGDADMGENAIQNAAGILFADGDTFIGNNESFLDRSGLFTYSTANRSYPRGLALHFLGNLLDIGLGPLGEAGISMRKSATSTNATLALHATGGIAFDSPVTSEETVEAGGFTLDNETVTDWDIFARASELAELSERVDGAVANVETGAVAAVSNHFAGVTADQQDAIDAIGAELHDGAGSVSNRLRLAEAGAAAAQAWAQTNRDDIADLRSDCEWLHAAATNNAANINILSAADNALANQIHAAQESISDLWSAIGYVANTNGAWHIVDAGDWYGLEWNGERVFGAVLDGPTGNGARILSLGFGEEEGELELTFVGAATNHLEACNDCTNWFIWDDCTWTYSGITGTVAIANAAETNWYRVVAEGAVYGWSNAAVVSYAPLYIGSQSNAGNRVATVGDVESAMSRASSGTKASVNRRAWKDNYNVEPTNLAWRIELGDTPYFADLSVGGWENTTVEVTDFEVVTNTVVETNGVEVVTNSVVTTNILAATTNTVTHTGRLGLNNEEIEHWSDLRTHIGSGFPLTNDADFATFSATGVGSIQFDGSTNELDVADGRLLFGGRPIDANLEAGHGISLTANTNTGAKVVAVTRNIDFDNVTIFGDLNVSGTQHHNVIIRHETNVYVGVQTNYVTTEVHTTNHVYQHTHIVTRDTNYVDEVVNVGGNVDNSKAEYVLSPVYAIDNSDTNAPALSATGSWDFTLAALSLGNNAVSSFNGWSGAVTLAAGSNIVFGTDSATRTLTINATVPEIDFTPYATTANLAGVAARLGGIETNITQHTGAMTNYITGPELDSKLADYAPASQVTVIATNLDGIVSALSNPVIETPDHKKWTMQGRYSNGQITHVWVPYVGLHSSPIRISMPDGRIFEMVGRYADGNTNLITHIWEEVAE